MTRTRKAYRLSQRVKYEDTKPEQIVYNILHDDLRLAPTKRTLEIDGYSITPDWLLLLTPEYFIARGHDMNSPTTLIEVDGIYHDSKLQQRKTRWRDGLLTQAGYRVIHVDAELTKNKAYQTYLKDRLSEAILSQEKVVRIDA